MFGCIWYKYSAIAGVGRASVLNHGLVACPEPRDLACTLEITPSPGDPSELIGPGLYVPLRVQLTVA